MWDAYFDDQAQRNEGREMNICGLIMVTISVWSDYKYCDPQAIVSFIKPPTVMWKCDCTRARRSAKFVIDEMVYETVDAYVEEMRGRDSE